MDRILQRLGKPTSVFRFSHSTVDPLPPMRTNYYSEVMRSEINGVELENVRIGEANLNVGKHSAYYVIINSIGTSLSQLRTIHDNGMYHCNRDLPLYMNL